MTFTKKFFWEKEEKNLMEWKDLFQYSQDEQGNIITNDKGKPIKETSGLLFNVLKEEFVTTQKLENINQLTKQLKEIKAQLEEQEKRRGEAIKGEVQSIKETAQALKKEIIELGKNTLLQITEGKNKAMKELQKQYLLEIGKEITDKNKQILSVLNQFLTGLNYELEGLDYNKVKEYKEKFKETIPKLDLSPEMKEQLLEFCTNENCWDRGDNDFKNVPLYYLLQRLTNAIYSGREPNKLIPYKVGQYKTGVEVIGSNKSKEAEKRDNQNMSKEGQTNEDITEDL